MKKIAIILILISGFAQAQTPPRTGYLVQPTKWKFVNPIWLDSGAYITKISKYGGQNRYLVYDSVKGTIGYRFVSSATTIDTTSLSNRINLRVKYTDTSSILAKYLRSADTLKLRRDVNLKVPYTGATKDVNIGTNTYIGHSLKSDASDGVLIEAANGTDVGIFGAGNTANSSLYGGLTIGSLTSGNGTDSVVVSSSTGLLKKRPASAFGSSYTGGNGIIVGGSTIYRDSLKSTGQYGNAWGNGMFSGSTNNRTIKWRTNNLQRMVLDSNGNVGIGTTTPVSRLHVGVVPTSSANYGLLSIGGGNFTGTGVNPFVGSAAGTHIAINTLGATAANFADWQHKGTSRFKVDSVGAITFGNGNTISSTGVMVLNGGIQSNSGIINAAGGSYFAASGNTVDHYYSGGNNSLTSGNIRYYQCETNFVPTSGTATFRGFEFNSTINQTGGANGITRGLYINPTLTAAADFRAIDVAAGKLMYSNTVTAGGTTGAQTINKISGSVNFAAAATTLVVTNSLVTTSSQVFVQVYGTDATFTSARVTLASGSFTITADVAPTAETKVGFFVIN